MLVDNRLHVEAFSERPIVFFVGERRSGALVLPVFYSIIMYGYAIHPLPNVLHQHASPIIIIVACSAGYAQEMRAIVAYVSVVSAEHVAVIFRTHVSSAAPCLVTNAEVLHFPRLFTAVFLAQLGHGSSVFRGHILHPLGHFLYCAATHVARNIRLTAQHLA